MGTATIDLPVNPHQLTQAIARPFTARADDAANTVEIEAPDLSDADLTSRLASIVYDPDAAAVEQLNERTLSSRAEQAIDGLKQIANSSGTLTGAQLSNAVRLLARVALAVVRLHLRKLDTVD